MGEKKKKKNLNGIPLIQMHLQSSICPSTEEYNLQLHTGLELLIYKASLNFVSFLMETFHTSAAFGMGCVSVVVLERIIKVKYYNLFLFVEI